MSCIPSNVKALALIRYITNYATKGDCSQYQRVIGAAIVQKSLEQKAAAIANREVLSLAQNMDQKFSLKAYNWLAYNKEISGPFAASTLLGLPEFYTPNRQIQKLNLYALRSRLAKLLRPNLNILPENSVPELSN